MTIEEINDFYSAQFGESPDFKEGYTALEKCERRSLTTGGMDVWVQMNPGRARSTKADTEASRIRERACFLCGQNRPEKQMSLPLIEGWDWLINPYPIFPVHFTVAFKEHEPQGEMPLDMIAAADANPDLAFFFNGARAGASAPDHLHFQGVLKEELPLLRIVEENHDGESSGYIHSPEMKTYLPMNFISFLIYPDLKGMALISLIPKIHGYDAATGKADSGMVNTIVWLDAARRLRCIVIPRKNHRPDLYFREDDTRRIISPGAVDMAGMLITPDRDTFEKITAEEIISIYGQTGLSNEEYGQWKAGADKILETEF